MKKLSEIKLNDFHEMNEMEMKNIVGGSGSESGSGSGTCKVKVTCGTASKFLAENISKSEAQKLANAYAGGSGGSCEDGIDFDGVWVSSGVTYAPRYTWCCESC